VLRPRSRVPDAADSGRGRRRRRASRSAASPRSVPFMEGSPAEKFSAIADPENQNWVCDTCAVIIVFGLATPQRGLDAVNAHPKASPRHLLQVTVLFGAMDGPPPGFEEGVPPGFEQSYEGEMKLVTTFRKKKYDFKLEGAELSWFDDGDKEGSVSMFDVTAARPSEDSDADDSDEEIELVTEDKTWRMRAEDGDAKAKWLECLSAAVVTAQATQGMTPEQRLEQAGLVYRLPDYGIPWIGEPPRKSYESSAPIKAKPMQDYGLHGSVRKLKICMGWWVKGHKPWKEMKGVHAGAALLDASGAMIDYVDYKKHKSECGAVSWDLNSPPPKPHEVEVGDPPEECEDPEAWAEEEHDRQKAIRKQQKRAAKHWAKKGDDEALKIKFHKLNPAVHYVVPIVSIIKPKYGAMDKLARPFAPLRLCAFAPSRGQTQRCI
jgi:hypothetical protein